MSKLSLILSGVVIAVFIWAGSFWWRVTTVECWFDGVRQDTCAVAAQLQNQRLLTLNFESDTWQTVRSFTAENQQNWQLNQWSKRLPNTVVLHYESSPGAYVINLPDLSWWLVNQRGFLQALSSDAASQSALTKIVIGPKWQATDYANYHLEPKLHTWLSEFDGSVRDQLGVPIQINVVDIFTVQVAWASWQLVVEPFMNVDQFADRISQIKLLLMDKSQTLEKDYKKLDLRYKLPVLEPKNPAGTRLFPSVVPKSVATVSASITPAAMVVTPTKKPTPTLTVTPTAELESDQVNQ